MITLRAAAFAVVVALLLGFIGSLALRPPGAGPAVLASSGGGTTGPAVNWRLPTAFGTNLPALGDNPLYVADALARSSSGRIVLDVYEPAEIVPAFEITDAVRQAVGAYIDSDTLVQNEEVIKDRILTLSAGFVKNYRVTTPAHLVVGGLYQVSIAAMVVDFPAPVAPATNNKPRFSMINSERIGGTYKEFR